MEESQRIREKIIPEELPILEKLSKELQKMILEIFPCEVINQESSPSRYKFSAKDLSYEFIFSAMGSFTIRPLSQGGMQRRSSPIFYLSVGKYSGNFFWEDANEENFLITKENLKEKILYAIQNYEQSVA